jgi:hypothetical protein
MSQPLLPPLMARAICDTMAELRRHEALEAKQQALLLMAQGIEPVCATPDAPEEDVVYTAYTRMYTEFEDALRGVAAMAMMAMANEMAK